MQENSKTDPDIDPSGLFSTYKTHPSNEHANSEEIGIIETTYPRTTLSSTSQDKEKNPFRALQIIIDGAVRITKTAVWSIAVLGGLFVAALATNTIDRAISIINGNLGTHIVSGEVTVADLPATSGETRITGLESSAITTHTPTNNTPDILASKRRAILEAKKAAKLLEEKQKSSEISSQ